jgi:hypothetical protein
MELPLSLDFFAPRELFFPVAMAPPRKCVLQNGRTGSAGFPGLPSDSAERFQKKRPDLIRQQSLEMPAADPPRR